MESGYVMSLSDFKHSNLIQIRFEPKHYGYFIGILIIDPDPRKTNLNQNF